MAKAAKQDPMPDSLPEDKLVPTRAVAHLKSITAYSPSRYHDIPKLPSEIKDPNAWDERTWKEHGHYNRENRLIIPGICFKLALVEAAKQAKQKIQSGGGQEWGTLFQTALQVYDPLVLPITKDELESEKEKNSVVVMSNANGRAGGGKRVPRRFPIVHQWEGDVSFCILNPDITEAKFHEYLTRAGLIIGIGRWRPANRGSNGMFKIVSLQWGLPLDI